MTDQFLLLRVLKVPETYEGHELEEKLHSLNINPRNVSKIVATAKYLWIFYNSDSIDMSKVLKHKIDENVEITGCKPVIPV